MVDDSCEVESEMYSCDSEMMDELTTRRGELRHRSGSYRENKVPQPRLTLKLSFCAE